MTLTELAQSMCEQATQLYEQADYTSARALYEQALSIQEQTSGLSHPDTARCLQGMGQVLMKLGDDALARSHLERALSIQERVLGPEHPDCVRSLHALGELSSNQGDSKTSLVLLKQAFALRKRTLGTDHPDTLESMTLMALVLAHQGDHAEAEQLLTRALSICEQALGEHHPKTARVLNGLGRLWATNEDTYARARPMYERALSINERLLGPDHPYTALALNNLAALQADMQDYDAALPLLERSLSAHQKIYGMENWRTSFVLINLADLHRRQGDDATARPLLERALIIREEAWGARHPETVKCLRKLVATLGNLQAEGDEAAMLTSMALYPCLIALEAADEKLDITDAMMPGAHLDPAKAAEQLHHLVAKLRTELARPPLSAADQVNLENARALAQQADELYERGDYAAAASRLEEALDLQERVLSEYHLDHTELLKKLADTRERQGQYSAVLPLVQRVVDIHERVLGPDHPTTMLALSELMSRQAYEYGAAATSPLQERILQSMEDTLGPDGPMLRLARQSSDMLGRMLGEGDIGPEHQGVSLSERREKALAAISPKEEELLDGLEDIDWHALQHAYGPADDVPQLLRLLLAGEQEVRDSAWQELYSNIWHQGDVYQATSYAVPFLIRMVESEAAPDKHVILDSLRAIAAGMPWLSKNHTWMETVLVQQGRDFQAETEQARRYAVRAHEAVGAGLDTYLSCLHHPASDVREAASALLCAFPEQAARVLPALFARVQSEPETDVKARLVQSLGSYLTQALPANERGHSIGLLEKLVWSRERRPVRFTAALALARVAGDEAAPEAIRMLEQAASRPAGLHSGREDFADIVIEDVCAALSHLSVERRIPVLTRMLGRVSRPDHAHQVAVLLLDSALLGKGRTIRDTGTPEASEDGIFYSTVHPIAADGVEERIYPRAKREVSVTGLTDAQRQALQAVLDSSFVWSIHSNLLEIYGLPGSASDLRELLESSEPGRGVSPTVE
jgi:tetratricopeptide (TPR) repeat protein